MAAIGAVVGAILLSEWRGLRGARSFTGNNLAAFIALLMAEEPTDRPSSTAVIYLFVGMLWALPLARDLTRRIPPVRFRLWPLGPGQQVAIRTLNLLLNPLIVIAVLFALLSRDKPVGVGLAAISMAAPFAVMLGQAQKSRRSAWRPVEFLPRPPGPLGGLVQSQLRELLQLLDTYLALLFAIGGLLYCRFSAEADPEAPVVLGVLVVLVLSTCAQGQTSFNAGASTTRMRLLPISGAALLFAKDAAWLLITAPLVVGFRALPCLAAAMAALVLGHGTSTGRAIEQKRWNFATGKLVPWGVLQMFALVAAGSAAYRWSWPAFAAVLAVYAGSLWWRGREWDRRR